MSKPLSLENIQIKTLCLTVLTHPGSGLHDKLNRIAQVGKLNAISGQDQRTVVVGHPSGGSNYGSVFIFKIDQAGVWDFHQHIAYTGHQEDARFGEVVAVNADASLLAVFLPSQDADGTVEVFKVDEKGYYTDKVVYPVSTKTPATSGYTLCIDDDGVVGLFYTVENRPGASQRRHLINTQESFQKKDPEVAELDQNLEYLKKQREYHFRSLTRIDGIIAHLLKSKE